MPYRSLVCLPVVAHVLAVLIGLSFEQQVGQLEDDAYYYIVTGENVCKLGRSTFDGVVDTNGYHPLWFATVTGLVCALRTEPRLYIPALVVLSSVFAGVFALLLRRLIAALSPRLSPLIVAAITVLVVTRANWILFAGMETTLAIPLLCALALETLAHLREPRPLGRYVGLGLLCAFTALARLDCILYAFACCSLILLRGHTAVVRTARRALAILIGMVPFFVYLLYNVVRYGSPMTVSARAKTLPSTEFVLNTTLLDWLTPNQALMLVVLPLLGALLVSSRYSPWKDERRLVAILTFSFPVAFYGLQMVASDWKLWAWYLYPLPLCLAMALTAFADKLVSYPGSFGDTARRSAVGATLLGLAVAGSLWSEARNLERPGRSASIAEAAIHLGEFMQSHHGYYAMGDRAGATAFVTGKGFLQLEGLAADHRMIKYIAARSDLRSTLADYGADYLVETLYTQSVPEGDCLEVTAPHLPARSARLSGRFCHPVFRYDSAVDGITTLVYAVTNSEAAAR